MNVTYEYRKKNGLCTRCGDRAEQGKTLCIGCQQLEAVKRMNRMSGEYLEKYKEYQRDYQREYRKTHKKDKKKYIEYNRRYRDKNPTCRFVYRMHYFKMNGERVRLSEVARRVKIPYGRLWQRLYRSGMSISEAIARG